MAVYPDDFPLPQRDSYGYTVDAGLISTPMESGGPRQRRKYGSMPHYFSLEFIVPRADLDSWQQWVNQNAYDWFEIPLVNMITIGDPLCSNYCFARFISDLSLSVLTRDFFSVTVQAELQPGQVNDNPARTDWIIGRTPDDPSPDWVIGGTPASPSPDWTIPV